LCGGWFQGKFSVSFGPKLGFNLWLQTENQLCTMSGSALHFVWVGGGGLVLKVNLVIALAIA
jgi:hypothetical protein